ncbi:MAG: DMT family transporter [Gemmatimonadaceae bacterium]|nr:DMT family transporter [Gemmatimonadaceae bacterium]
MPTISATTLAMALILGAGTLIAIQGPINATLMRAVGSSVNAALISFLVGTLALIVVAMWQRTAADGALVRALPWWAWVGGLCGAVFVAVAAYAAPRIGVANMLTLSVAGQLITAIVLDHRGAFGVPQQSVSGGRIVGILLVVVGAVLVRRH